MSRPLFLIIGHRLRLFAGLLIGLAIVAGFVIWLAGGSSTQQDPPRRNSLPVNGPLFNIESNAEGKSVNDKNTSDGEGYFVTYRLEREKARQEAKAMLAALLNGNEPKNKEAEAKWLELTSKMEKESEIENLLKIKGFQDAVAAVNLDNVNVIVYGTGLTPNQVNLIQDIVVRVTKVRIDRIIVSTKI